jgi:hypothetical protein
MNLLYETAVNLLYNGPRVRRAITHTLSKSAPGIFVPAD